MQPRYALGTVAKRRYPARDNVTVTIETEPTRALQRSLYTITRRPVEAMAPLVATTLPDILSRVAGPDNLRPVIRDAPSDDIGAAVDQATTAAAQIALTLTPSLREYVAQLQDWHSARWRASIRRALDFDPAALMQRMDAEAEVEAWIRWTSGLIRNIPEDMRRRIEAKVFPAVQNATPVPQVMRELRQEMGFARQRALLIARDQARKLSGQLDQLRHREAGITHYRWRTVQDLRVRDHHQTRHDRVFPWSEPPPGGHPKTEINCRCTAQPYIDLLEEVQPARAFATNPPNSGPFIDPATLGIL